MAPPVEERPMETLTLEAKPLADTLAEGAKTVKEWHAA